MISFGFIRKTISSRILIAVTCMLQIYKIRFKATRPPSRGVGGGGWNSPSSVSEHLEMGKKMRKKVHTCNIQHQPLKHI